MTALPHADTAPPDVEFAGVTKRFGSLTAVDNLSLSVRQGEFLALLGPSGCGKTTCLRMIAGFEAPDSGTITIAGKDMRGVSPGRRPANTVFQNYALFGHLSVLKNVEFGLKQHGVPRAERTKRAMQALEMVHLSGRATNMPKQLSGGEQQRVALARALVLRPKVLLLDEPLGALDLQLRKEMQIELRRLHRDLGITFIFVTHDQGEAMSMADRVAVMNHGRIEQLAAPEVVYQDPANSFVASFIGEMNIFPGVAEVSEGHVAVSTPMGTIPVAAERAIPVGSEVKIGLRPESLILATPDGATATTNCVQARLVDRGLVGEMCRIAVCLGDGTEVSIRRPRSEWALLAHLSEGDLVKVTWSLDDVVVLSGA